MGFSSHGERVPCQFKSGCPEDGVREIEVPGNGTIHVCPYHEADVSNLVHGARLRQRSSSVHQIASPSRGERAPCQFKPGCPEEGIREVEVLGNGTIKVCPYHAADPEDRAHLARLWQLSRLRGVRLTPEAAKRVNRAFVPVKSPLRRPRRK